MSVLSNIGLVAAERLEHSMGASVALRSYKALLSDDDPRVVAKATAGAIRCALALGDELELEQIAAFWGTQSDVPTADVLATCRSLAAGGRYDQAIVLGAAEMTRNPTAKHSYLLARLHEVKGDRDEALAAYATAAGLAGERVRIATLARCRQLEVLVADGDEAGMVELAAQLGDVELTAQQRLLVARAQLKSPSKFARASALSSLEEVAGGDDELVAKQAVIVAARHADEMAASLSWVEADRIEATLLRWPDEGQRKVALAGLAIRRAVAGRSESEVEGSLRASMSGSVEAGRYLDLAHSLVVDGEPIALEELEQQADPIIALASSGLNSVAWLLNGELRKAVAALDRVASRLDEHLPVPASVWTAVLLALRNEQPEARLAGRQLCQLLVSRHLGIPPRGFMPYARALMSYGARELGVTLLHAAALHLERDAAEALLDDLVRRAWSAYERGDESEARSLLREARSLSRR